MALGLISRLRYSPYPREAYTVIKNNVRYGYGANHLVENLAVWNLFWLSWPRVDDLLTFKGDPTQVPHYHRIMHDCVECSQQLLNGVKVSSWVRLATPADFVKGVTRFNQGNLVLSHRYPDWESIINVRKDMFQRGDHLLSGSGAVIIPLRQSSVA